MPSPATLLEAIRNGDAAGVGASLYDTVEIRTSLSMPVSVKTADILKPGDPNASGQPPWWLRMLKPTVVFTGAGGRQVIAPTGVAGDGTVPMVLALGSLVALGFWLGRATK